MRAESSAFDETTQRHKKTMRMTRCCRCGRRLLFSATEPAAGGDGRRCSDGSVCAKTAPIYADELADFHEVSAADAKRWKIMSPCKCCQAMYTWRQFLDLPAPAAGNKQEGVDETTGERYFLELRNCHCGSTLARREPT